MEPGLSFVQLAAGAFLMGTPESQLSALARAYGGTRESYREESPQHQLELPAYQIATLPVTNALFHDFIDHGGYQRLELWDEAGWQAREREGWQEPLAWRNELLNGARQPLVGVSWYEARAFCHWLAAKCAAPFRLPSEAEWERAARGDDGRVFPWGDTWEQVRATTRETGLGATTEVGALDNASPAGCRDMAGNIWEWTATLDAPYPYRSEDGRENPLLPGRRILRGGCYANPHGFARCACRFRLRPELRNAFLGFRLAQ
jgi:formylglycine-generating enzyme required for sulfatase activity